jgi:hypothetical protein
MSSPLTSSRRGFALLQAIVLAALFAVLAVTILQLASRGNEMGNAKQKYDEFVSCADAARELLHSQFSAFGISPVQLTMNSVINNERLATGHYDSVNVASVEAASGAGTSSFGVSDISNKVASASLGGQTYRMTVVCSNAQAGSGVATRQSEIEFLVKFGL